MADETKAVSEETEDSKEEKRAAKEAKREEKAKKRAEKRRKKLEKSGATPEEGLWIIRKNMEKRAGGVLRFFLLLW